MSGRLSLHVCGCGRRLWTIDAGPFTFTYCHPCDGGLR